MSIGTGLTFDDVLLIPGYSKVLPKDVSLKTSLTKKISLNLPLISAAMDTVTESATAIVMAQQGGIGTIHRNFSIERQAEEVKKVKTSEYWIITDPMTVTPETTLEEVTALRQEFGKKSFLVTKGTKLVGILTNRDLRFETNLKKQAKDVMSTKVITVDKMVGMDEAKKILRKHRIEKLPIVDKNRNLKGLITVTDIQKDLRNPNAQKDKKGQLMVGAAVGPRDFKRVEKLIEAGADVIAIDTAHGHSKNVIDGVKKMKKQYNIEIVAGNIATKKAAEDLISAGADAIKVGVGPGAICTTRVISGVGVPQITAIQDCSLAAAKYKIPVVADGGIRYSGDVTKAIAAGAHCVMIGSLFAGCEETPGRIIYMNNRKFKQYRGMGSLGAMRENMGGRDRYFQAGVTEPNKLVPEGIEGVVPYKGSLEDAIFQLVGGLRSGMGMCGSETIEQLRTKSKMLQITTASVTEGHPHDISITEQSPNYP